MHYKIGWVLLSDLILVETCLSSGKCSVREIIWHWLQLCPFYNWKYFGFWTLEKIIIKKNQKEVISGKSRVLSTFYIKAFTIVVLKPFNSNIKKKKISGKYKYHGFNIFIIHFFLSLLKYIQKKKKKLKRVKFSKNIDLEQNIYLIIYYWILITTKSQNYSIIFLPFTYWNGIYGIFIPSSDNLSSWMNWMIDEKLHHLKPQFCMKNVAHPCL